MVAQAFQDAVAQAFSEAFGVSRSELEAFKVAQAVAAYSEHAAAESKSTGLGGVAGTNATGNPADAAIGFASGGWITGGTPVGVACL